MENNIFNIEILTPYELEEYELIYDADYNTQFIYSVWEINGNAYYMKLVLTLN